MSGQESRLRGRWGEEQAAEYLRPQGEATPRPEIIHLENAF